ncbi:SDR family oxidoreductase [Dickeya sp. ws52]|uniref:SDR family oxidoreductase n=1 Tax=Dickeya sp. ws52 TaxID=2576377 RepID=UPI00117D0A68|nr:SDR family NAD(P)-dependent oxidoreductase [Dickeya sp. ws52]TYL42916.1 SDR family NAD(P)-dependent oxidoreductase [Dickeya sp. ws52]
MNMTGNTILITGGGSGIGLGLAAAFYRRGNQVIIAGRHETTLRQAAALFPGMVWRVLDQRDPLAVSAFVAQLTQDYPALNVLINNAGIQRHEDLTQPDPQLINDTISTNLLGPLWLTSALTPHLLEQSQAAVLNVTSELAFLPQALTPTYCASKAALHSYTEALRCQLRQTSVRVVEIIPPWVQTGLQGAHGYDPRAMPLPDFIDETLALLSQQPQLDEIVVDRARALRFAERDGVYAERFWAFNVEPGS